MTRERAKELAPIIQAYVEGKEVQAKLFGYEHPWASAGNPQWSDDAQYRIKPAPSLRPMTRGEVLYMVTTTTAMVVRGLGGMFECPAQVINYADDISEMEYAIIDRHGEPIDGWHKFEIEE